MGDVQLYGRFLCGTLEVLLYILWPCLDGHSFGYRYRILALTSHNRLIENPIEDRVLKWGAISAGNLIPRSERLFGRGSKVGLLSGR